MITHKKWMEDTYLTLSRRSNELKKVDDAIQKYNTCPGDDDTFFALLHAFDDWKATKTDWSKSKRNHKGAVVQLNRDLQLQPIFQIHLSQMAVDEKGALKKLLANKKLIHKTSYLKKVENAAKSAYKIIKFDNEIGLIGQGIANPHQSASHMQGPLAKQLIRAAFGNEGSDAEMMQTVTGSLGSNFMSGFVQDVMPIVGTLYSGYKLVDYWKTAGEREWNKYQLECGRGSIREGNASAALNAVKEKIRREQSENARKAVMQTATFACQIVAPPGVGNIAGAVNGIGQLGQTIFLLGRDYREKNAANKELRDNIELDAKIFNVNPIIGCYYLVSCTRSNILNILFTDSVFDGWQSEVERMNEQVAPIIASARNCIKNSRYVIEGMPMFATEVILVGESEEKKQQYLQAHIKGREASKRQQKYYSKGSLYRLLHDKPKSYMEEGIRSEPIK